MTTSTSSLVPLAIPVYKKIISLFPQNYFRFCFAYGSGVLKQGGVSVDKKPMVDMIFVVDDSEGFHSQNLCMNPHHYSFLRYGRHKLITMIQEKWPAKVYFNTLIPYQEEGITFKYGVVSRNDLINDLLDWDYLYLSGRLHKPVKFIDQPPKDIATALRQNLFSALHAALIVLPEVFTEREMYKTIANLSYNGDFRMVFGEDKNKVSNIVDKQVLEFRKLYRPLLKTLDDYVEIPDNEPVDQVCMQDISPLSRMYHLFQLPKIPQKQLINYWRLHVSWRRRDAEDILKNIANNLDLGEIFSDCLKRVVFKSSIEQSLKGVFTAGLWKSIKYSNKKIVKMVKARERM